MDDLEEEVEPLAEPVSNRRSHPRHAVDEPASLRVLKHETTIPCRVIDISLSGCRLQAADSFLPGLHARVEVSFKIRGLILRFNGEAQWTDDRLTVGIHFVDVTSRRAEELGEILFEVAAENAAQAEKRAAEERAAEERAAQEALLLEEEESPGREGKGPQWEPGPGASRTTVTRTELRQRTGTTATKFAASDRRKQVRQEVDTTAEIYLIKIGTCVTGRIRDLSPGGCHIRTDERFPVGIYIRVETVFRLHGLPFRLGGVTQAIHDMHNVGIRFIDMSPRKREYVDQMSQEIEEMRAWHEQAESGRMDKSSSKG